MLHNLNLLFCVCTKTHAYALRLMYDLCQWREYEFNFEIALILLLCAFAECLRDYRAAARPSEQTFNFESIKNKC